MYGYGYPGYGYGGGCCGNDGFGGSWWWIIIIVLIIFFILFCGNDRHGFNCGCGCNR